VQSASARKQLTALVLIGLNRMASSFAEFEHAMIHEWTTAWLAGAPMPEAGTQQAGAIAEIASPAVTTALTWPASMELAN
jgi:hypothetical protein